MEADAGAPGGWAWGSTALAVAHPGHELRLTHWISAARPATFILTAGARYGEDRARVAASARLAAELGSGRGELFGDHLDRDVYGWIMQGEAARFIALATALAASFVARRTELVVTDAWQLYNPVHDLWHLTVRAAAALAQRRMARPVTCLDYAVVPAAMALRGPGPLRHHLALTPDQATRKLELAASFPEIADDVEEIVRVAGPGFLALETLHAVQPLAVLVPVAGEKPAYEMFGEQRVADGRYHEVLRWSHMAPIVAALGALASDLEAAA